VNALENGGSRATSASSSTPFPTAANVLYHAKIVARFAAQRNLIEELTAAAELAWSSGQDPERLAQTLVSRFLPLASPENSGEGYVDAKTMLYALMEDIESRRGTEGIIGLSTGFVGDRRIHRRLPRRRVDRHLRLAQRRQVRGAHQLRRQSPPRRRRCRHRRRGDGRGAHARAHPRERRAR
jgi:hypothetical protein